MCKRLRALGTPHAALDNLERGHQEALPGTDLILADLRSPGALDEALAGRAVEAVIHFAAYIEVGESVKDPAAFWQNNTYGTWNLLEWARRQGGIPVVFSSTAAVYGEPQQIPIPEKHPTAPTSPYGDSKLAVERMLDAYSRAYGQRSVALRYFNACGCDPDGVLGEDHRPETHLVPRCLLAAAGRAPELTLFGEDYPTPDGTCIRDYVHVEDLVDAHVLALDHLAAGGGSRVYNLGSGSGFSVKEVIEACEQASGRAIPVKSAPRRAGDPARLIADSSAIRGDWGWSPRFNSLVETASHAWTWMSSHPNGYA